MKEPGKKHMKSSQTQLSGKIATLGLAADRTSVTKDPYTFVPKKYYISFPPVVSNVEITSIGLCMSGYVYMLLVGILLIVPSIKHCNCCAYINKKRLVGGIHWE